MKLGRFRFRDIGIVSRVPQRDGTEERFMSELHGAAEKDEAGAGCTCGQDHSEQEAESGAAENARIMRALYPDAGEAELTPMQNFKRASDARAGLSANAPTADELRRMSPMQRFQAASAARHGDR